MSTADQINIPERAWAVTVLRKILSSTRVPFSDTTIVMLDLVEMLDSNIEEREAEELMPLSESILKVLLAVSKNSSIWGKNNSNTTHVKNVETKATMLYFCSLATIWVYPCTH